jgi:hypothetical protein
MRAASRHLGSKRAVPLRGVVPLEGPLAEPAQDAPGWPLRLGSDSGAADRVNGARSWRNALNARCCAVRAESSSASATRGDGGVAPAAQLAVNRQPSLRISSVNRVHGIASFPQT